MTAPRGDSGPTVAYDLDEQTYHRDPALSSSGAKLLLPPSCPALFKWRRDNPVESATFDFGRAAHAVVLGAGAHIKVVDAPDWRSKAARDDRDAIRAAGHTPLLAADWSTVQAMADAIRTHPVAAALLDPDHGRPEVSIRWHDHVHGIDRRARLDWLPDSDGGQMVVPDLKTTVSADPGEFGRSVFRYGYALQAQFYTDAVTAAGLADDVTFRFVAVEKTPPHLVNVFELDALAHTVGRAQVDEACRIYAECTRTDTWPGYGDDVTYLTAPAWALDQWTEDVTI